MQNQNRHIAILDFGSQYMHLISRRIRQLGVRAKIYPTDVSVEELLDGAWGIIISGGPNSVNDQKLAYDKRLFDMPIPVLGLCYGHQLMAYHLGGVVTPAHNREYGLANVELDITNPLTKNLSEREQVWMSHWDSVTQVPEGFSIIGKTSDCPVAAMSNVEKKRYGLQFHPEVHHSTHGIEILRNFVFDICGAEKNWSMDEYLNELSEDIKTTVAGRKVFLLVSGGVDSTVAFALLQNILGKDRVYGLHVDNGFMRKDESRMVGEMLAAAGFTDLHVVDASEQFLEAVKGMTDPETKRHTIGRVFLEVQRQEFAKLNLNEADWVLGQGTIYPDTIESGGTKTSDTIKTHHNRVPEIMKMIEEGRVVEPLATLYKDEVRAIGVQLGLSEHLINRWPFPGPGLSIRTLCSDGSEMAPDDIARVNSQLTECAQGVHAMSAVLPVRSVGVQGDQRSYQFPAVVWSAQTPEWATLNELSVQITNTVHGINRVVYWAQNTEALPELKVHEGYLTRDRLDLLREVDSVVSQFVDTHHLHSAIWQFPIVLLPLYTAKGACVVLRPIESQEAMTVNWYQMDRALFDSMATEVLKVSGIGGVMLDITNKPPATIEWE
ncbi:MAG: glutamine-hydrolyzing GMP synthase [Candidatus Kerfeldbacteria bacterium]|nr:glutamine-hydrolyzing GMP synthase [Candidatus Kerfeldbacteria bacterium]